MNFLQKLIYKGKFSTWYNITIIQQSMIQQYDIYNLEIHAGQGLEIGRETTNATKGIKLSRRKIA